MDQQPANNQTEQFHKKHLGMFWPIVILVVVCTVVAGVIVWTSFNDTVSDDLASMVFKIHSTKKSGNPAPPTPTVLPEKK